MRFWETAHLPHIMIQKCHPLKLQPVFSEASQTDVPWVPETFLARFPVSVKSL